MAKREDELGPFQIKCRNLGIISESIEFLPKEWPNSQQDIENVLYEAGKKSYEKYKIGLLVGQPLLSKAKMLWRYRPDEMKRGKR